MEAWRGPMGQAGGGRRTRGEYQRGERMGEAREGLLMRGPCGDGWEGSEEEDMADHLLFGCSGRGGSHGRTACERHTE